MCHGSLENNRWPRGQNVPAVGGEFQAGLHAPFTRNGEEWKAPLPTEVQYALRCAGSFPHCSSRLASPASATDNLGESGPSLRGRAHGGAAHGIPSYARQTGLACSACHYQFLTLTPFGRKFKLNGYTLTNLPSLVEKDSTNGGRLSLSPFSLLSAMVTTSVTHTKDDLPDTQNDAVALPQELSGFLAGRICSQHRSVLAVHVLPVRTARSGSTTWISGSPTRRTIGGAPS